MYVHTHSRHASESARARVYLSRPVICFQLSVWASENGNSIPIVTNKMCCPQGRLFMYVELGEQHDFILYRPSQMVIAAFLNISVKAAHRKTVTESSSSRVHYKIIYSKSAWGVYDFFRPYCGSYITIWIQNYCSMYSTGGSKVGGKCVFYLQ